MGDGEWYLVVVTLNHSEVPYFNLADGEHQRRLNKGETKDIFAESIPNLSIHVFSYGAKVDGHVGGRRGVLSYLENDLLGVIIADGKLEEVQIVLFRDRRGYRGERWRKSVRPWR